MYKVFPSALTTEEVGRIRQYFSGIDPVQATIGFENANINKSYRVSELRWLTYQNLDLKNRFIFDMFLHYAREANYEMHLDISNGITDIQHTTYRAEAHGKYDWHHDVQWTDSTHRKTRHRLGAPSRRRALPPHRLC